jgi:hypothetical protein
MGEWPDMKEDRRGCRAATQQRNHKNDDEQAFHEPKCR